MFTVKSRLHLYSQRDAFRSESSRGTKQLAEETIALTGSRLFT
jgi:hypothetical protein